MKIVIADDAALIREGIAGIVTRAGHTVAALLTDATELAAYDFTDIDLAIVDVRMPPLMADDGIHAALALREKYPRLGILILSQYVSPMYAAKIVGGTDGTAIGYLLKDRVADVLDFIHALTKIADGGMVVDPEVAMALMHRSKLEGLTPRENEVLRLMATGLSNTEIERELFLSSQAVSKHVANIFMKLGLDAHQHNRRVRAVLAYLSAHSVQP